MYHVPNTPRPVLLPFLARCLWFGASRGAIYGLIWGAGYGLLFYIIGALLGGPIGLVFGAALGGIDGLICGVIVYRLGASLTADSQLALRLWMGIFSFFACVFGGQITMYGQGGYSAYVWNLSFLWRGESIIFIIIPALIAGLCGYAATGRLLRWYTRPWVLGAKSADLQLARQPID